MSSSSPIIYTKDSHSDCYYVCSENKWISHNLSNGYYANNLILNKIKNNNGKINDTFYDPKNLIDDNTFSSLYWCGSANIKFVDNETNMHIYQQFAKIPAEYFAFLCKKNENKTP